MHRQCSKSFHSKEPKPQHPEAKTRALPTARGQKGRALHNDIKHSGARQAEVQLRVDSGEIHLSVSDLGKGFDVEAALAGKGLGLTGIRERVRLLNGTIEVESKPVGGTTIYVRVPFELGHEAQWARMAAQ